MKAKPTTKTEKKTAHASESRARQKGHFVFGKVTKESQRFLDRMMTAAEYDRLLVLYVSAIRAEAKTAKRLHQTAQERAVLIDCDPTAHDLAQFLSPNALADDISLAMEDLSRPRTVEDRCEYCGRLMPDPGPRSCPKRGATNHARICTDHVGAHAKFCPNVTKNGRHSKRCPEHPE